MEIQLYVSRWCGECDRAAELLGRHGLPFERIDVGDPDACCRLHELTGGSSVPQAVVDGRPIGGYRELAALIQRRALPPPAPERSVPAPMRKARLDGILGP